MRIGSLVILGSVFMSAFAGRAAVLASNEAGDPGRSPIDEETRCVNGAFADELLAQSERLEDAMVRQKAEDQKRAVLTEHVNKRIAELERLNADLSALAAKLPQEPAHGASSVSNLYERMKPDLAGVIISEMDPKFAASLLKSMKADSASNILAAIDPSRAYAITVLMAEPS
jgi:flagellar motility protein MotE (MotC chaperone)